MKILAISFSPRKNGNTETLLNQVLAGSKQEGAEVELFSIAGKNIKPCRGCFYCMATNKCIIDDDDMAPLYQKMIEADGIVFGTPIYFYGMTGQGKTLVDRTNPLIPYEAPGRVTLSNKVAGIVTVAGSAGSICTVHDLQMFIHVHRMIPANFVSGYAVVKGEISQLEKCMKAAHDLGRQMVMLASKKFEYPSEIPFSHIVYGTHTK